MKVDCKMEFDLELNSIPFILFLGPEIFPLTWPSNLCENSMAPRDLRPYVYI